jgi:CDP-4-dehydro-6-deoxyglucose reductase
VHEAVLADHPDLSAHDLYMSGPPAMIDSGIVRVLPVRRI